MTPHYRRDLAYIHSAAFETLARGAAPEIIRRLRAAKTPVRGVLDVGCGAGPLSAALAAEGFEVTGVDCSEDLVAMARVRAPAARFVCASIYDTAIDPCGAIIALGEPLTYHPPKIDADLRVRDFFRRAAAALTPGGLLIFDVIESGEPPLTARTWSAGEDWAVLVDTVEDSAARKLTRDIQTFRAVEPGVYRRDRETHHVRLFESAALCRELAALGFTVETSRAYGAQALAPRRRAFFCTSAYSV